MLKRSNEWLLPDYVRQHGHAKAEKVALIADDAILTWSDVADRMRLGAEWLKSRGILQGARVAYLVGSGAEGVVVTLAIWHADAVAVPLSPMLQPEQIRSVLMNADASMLVADRAHAELARTLADCVETVAFDFPAAESTSPTRTLHEHEAPIVPRSFAQPATLIYSSGTTSEPKGIEHSASARLQMAQGLAVALRVDERAVALIATPISSNASWLLLLPCLLAGATVIWLPAFDSGSWWRALTEQRVTHAFGVPLMWRRILAADPRPSAPADQVRLQVVLSAGSALPVELKLALRDRFGPAIFELYGCTEGVATLLTPECPDDKLDSVGQAILGTDVAIVDEHGRRARVGELGEIVGRSSSVMSGYFRRPDTTRQVVWTDESGAEWIRTGDIGCLDERGFLKVKDRLKDMLVSGGQNVYPSDVEAVLLRHPDVMEAAVLGLSHETWGEVPGALVRLHAGRRTDAQQLMAWANGLLAKHQRLHRIRFTGTPFPRNALGKVLKRELRDQWRRDER